MMLINADALIENVEYINTKFEGELYDAKEHPESYTKNFVRDMETMLSGMAHIEQLIFEAPAVDAVEVVRCRDCRWDDGCFQEVGSAKYGYHDIEYCSRGERWPNDPHILERRTE